MEKLPWYLEYFLEDILWKNRGFSVKKMFGWFWIFKNKKIFALYISDEIYFRKNIFIEDFEQFYYERNWKKIFLPYFKVDESFIEDSEKLELNIFESLNY